jgi:CheY-like chemotaxis protein
MTTDPTGVSNPPSILIVDDIAQNLSLLAQVLRARGYEPRPVLSGRQALAAAHADPPDLILLDIGMPEMDGFDLCARLKADEALKEIPVIFISGLNETEDKVKAFSLGGVDYVTKPFHAEEIDARVRTHLRLRSLQRELRLHNEHLEREVAERTRELAHANHRLTELGRLKDGFLQMISHELRTPANGVVGIGELLIDLCPPTDECARYSGHFRRSKARLLDLIADATTLANLETQAPKGRAVMAFSGLLAEVSRSLPEIRIVQEWPAAVNTVRLEGDPALLERVLETILLMATCFSQDKQIVHLKASDEASGVRLAVAVDALSLSHEQATDFFNIASLVRAASTAESLGLAPLVAHKIVTAFGGELRLVKGEGRTGSLEALFLKDSDDLRSA